MKLAELFPALADAALRLRQEGDGAMASGFDALLQKLQPHGDTAVEELPLKPAPKPKKASERPADTEASDDGGGLLQAQLDSLLARASDPALTLTAIREEIAAVCSSTALPTLRRIGKTFLHLPLSGKSKRDIEDLLYGHVARRKERTSW
ncbi:MAG: hypothetical protein ACOYMN_02040 [Roseimicrobium sp.]